MILGVAGKLCSGKSFLCEMLASKKLQVLDLDLIGHEALEVHRSALVDYFGTSVLTSGGTIDRKALAQKVFSNRANRHVLETLVHPWIEQRALETISSGGSWVVSASLLHRAIALQERCLCVIWVRSPFSLRLWRAYRKRGLPLSDALRRMRAQRGLGPKHFLPGVDIHIVRNGWRGSKLALERQLLSVLSRISQKK